MYIVRFVRRDWQPVEEYFYSRLPDALYHFQLFAEESDPEEIASHYELYKRIDLLEEDTVIRSMVYVNEDPVSADSYDELTPSYHGEKCLFNGEHEGYEITCDNCDFYMECFPDRKELMEG